MTTLPPLIDEQRLQRYLAERIPGADALLRVERVFGGHSNETFYIGRGDQEWVLRRPPRGPLLPTAHDVLREYRVLKALHTTNVPTPRVLLVCDDVSITGAPFYLMERKYGIVIRDELPPYANDAAGRRTITKALIDALAALHSVDWQAVGLGDFGKPEGYVERQIRRWTGQLEKSRQRPLPDLDTVTAWLVKHMPVSGSATIVHGDYRLDNSMYAGDRPELIAIFDWEMATIGDPLADLGYLLSNWREAGDPLPEFTLATRRITETPGFFTRAEIADYYAARTGRSIRDMAFYEALAIWKLAILLEGSYQRHRSGTTDDPFFEQLETGVPGLARRALEICRSSQKWKKNKHMQDPFLFQRENAAELFIVRHGDAIPEADEIIPSGIYDNLPLSKIGRQQAQDLAERLSAIQFDAIYSSPLLRCQQTAAPLAGRLNLTPIIVDGIKEIKLGNLRPLPDDKNDLAALYQALQERQRDIVRLAGETGRWDAIPDSEPSKAFRQRVVAAFDEIANRHIGQRVVAFAHGGVVNAYAAETLGLERDFFFPAANTSITVIRVAGKKRVLYILNDIGHIRRSQMMRG